MHGVSAGEPSTMTATDRTASVADRARPIAAGAPVVAAHFLGDVPVFVLGEEALLFAPKGGEPERVVVHGGAILAAASHGACILTGGDDGNIVATRHDRTPFGAKASPPTVEGTSRRRGSPLRESTKASLPADHATLAAGPIGGPSAT